MTPGGAIAEMFTPTSKYCLTGRGEIGVYRGAMPAAENSGADEDADGAVIFCEGAVAFVALVVAFGCAGAPPLEFITYVRFGESAYVPSMA